MAKHENQYEKRGLTQKDLDFASKFLKFDPPEPKDTVLHEDYAYMAESLRDAYNNPENRIDPKDASPTVVCVPPARIKGYFDDDPDVPFTDFYKNAYLSILRHATSMAMLFHGEEKLEFVLLHFLAGDDIAATPYFVKGENVVEFLKLYDERKLDAFGASDAGFDTKNELWLPPLSSAANAKAQKDSGGTDS